MRCLHEDLLRRELEVLVLRPAQIQVKAEGQELQLWYEGAPLKPALVVGWTSGMEGHYGNFLLKMFKQLGYTVINDGPTLEAMQSKAMNSALLVRHNLPHVPALICGRDTPVRCIVEALGLPLVFKPDNGSKGEGVRPLYSEAEVLEVLASATDSQAPLYFQQFVDKPGRDIRVQCADFKPVFGFYRYAQPGAFLSNIAVGAKIVMSEPLPDEAYQLAERAARAFNAAMAGVDLIETAEGLKILEVNSVPGFQTVAPKAGEFSALLMPLCDKATVVFGDMIELRLNTAVISAGMTALPA
ncbi:ATP-grasp domain-containing protein [Pseudomonas fluorescens]|uniref:ATP-grasp domain-containing protein n=1 Tax=Pseudomonas fluorescens TaxID=294 RepID=UPI00123FA344|nr:hypothetical protein [Pseudomonas fluorescens]